MFLFLDNLDYLSNSPMQDLKVDYDIFNTNTELQMKMKVRMSPPIERRIIQYLHYVLFNGGDVLLD
jgi:hypothetical protein